MGEASGGGAARAGRGGEEGSSEWGPQEGSGGGAGRGGVDGAGLGAWWCGEALAVLRARAGAHGLLETPGWAAGDDGVKRLRAGRWAVELVWPGENVCVLNLETGALQLCLPLHSPYKPDAPPLPRTKWTRLPPPYKVDAPPSPVQTDWSQPYQLGSKNTADAACGAAALRVELLTPRSRACGGRWLTPRGFVLFGGAEGLPDAPANRGAALEALLRALAPRVLARRAPQTWGLVWVSGAGFRAQAFGRRLSGAGRCD